jgi:hypothetical protein
MLSWFYRMYNYFTNTNNLEECNNVVITNSYVDEIKKNNCFRKPDAYKNINSSQVQYN